MAQVLTTVPFGKLTPLEQINLLGTKVTVRARREGTAHPSPHEPPVIEATGRLNAILTSKDELAFSFTAQGTFLKVDPDRYEIEFDIVTGTE